LVSRHLRPRTSSAARHERPRGIVEKPSHTARVAASSPENVVSGAT
jgi:hypothetical protein